MWYNGLFEELCKNADAQNAVKMSAYMRDLFPFLGIPTPMRKKICRPYLKAAKKETGVDYAFTELCWEKEHREFQYVAIDYLILKQKEITAGAIPKLREYITTKPWWDTVDALDNVMGELALADPSVNDTLLTWSTEDDIWLRRIAIDHQLGRKDKTDARLLAKIIENNFGSDEFFINKAIGWSLREYSKTNPDWVRAFIEKNRNKMATLSIREGSKYI